MNTSDEAVKIYLDVCSLQRPFDDQRQARIRLEAEAVKLIIARVEDGDFTWLTSEVVDYEVAQNPDAERAFKARLLAAHAETKVIVGANETARANELEQLGFTGFDALHLACAESGNADVFLTTDDKLLKRAARVATKLGVRVANPLQWAQETITV
ncbi:MAG: PIN domain-containing protein [Pyrinomonadaceae bacterium]|nr:PIN domain-containing protein [Pyrinomonadaceae bacterium]